MLRRLSVRGKILAALAVPVLVLFIASAYITDQSVGDARVAAVVRSLVDVFPAQDTAIDALQAERSATDAVLRKDDGAQAELDKARAATDAALEARDAQYRAVGTGVLDDRVATAVDRTLDASSAVATIRRQIEAGGATTTYADQSYQAIVQTALGVPSTLADTVPDRDLARYINAYYLVDYAVAQFTLETNTGSQLVAVAQKLPEGTTIEEAGNLGAISAAIAFASTIAQDDALVTEANTLLAQLGLSGSQMSAPSGEYQVLRNALGAVAVEVIKGENGDQWPKLAQAATDEKTKIRDSVRSEVAHQTDVTQTSAVTQTVVTIGITLLALALAIVVALGIARQIVRPLRRLTAAASTVREELPRLVEQVAEPGRAPDTDLEQIPVESTDEVGQLARAFNDVNATTIQVAKEQAALRGSIAEMFVNVARRDQVLLNRQLSFLDDLERTEEDPGSLANLFRLDHLATRMRRNAESLLVLAGIDSGRRVRQPMPTSDVIRTASSEIEMYDRIRLVLPVDPLMLGHNALSAAHLLAELFENATRFSEPHTPVEVSTNRTTDGVQILVRDYGLGMGPDELREATARVSSQNASEVLGAQRLGLYVVGRLAGRLGASVQFVSTGENGQGTTVIVSFPAALFVSDSQVPLPQPTDPLAPATQAAVQELTRGASAPEPAGAPEAVVLPEPEPEVVQAVDLDALTDGVTATGMPRRRTARPEPAPAPTGGGVVLPPLTASELPTDLGETTTWAPPSVPTGGTELPSRRRASDVPAAADTATGAEPLALAPSAASPGELPDATAVDLVAIPDDMVRTSMFSGFRSMTQLQQQKLASEDGPVSSEPAPQGSSEPDAVVVPDAIVPGWAAEASDALDATQVALPPVDEDTHLAYPADREVDAYEPAAHEPQSYEPAAYESAAYEPEPLGADPFAAESLAVEPYVPGFAPEQHGPADTYAPESSAAGPVFPETSYQALFAPDLVLPVEEESGWAPQFEAGATLPSRGHDAAVAAEEPGEAVGALWEPAPAGAPASPYSDLGGYFGHGSTGEQEQVADAAADVAPDEHPAAAHPTVLAADVPALDQPEYEQVADERSALAQDGAPATADAFAEEPSVATEADPFVQQLPAFDDLLTNLPTRRDVREAAKRNRGWLRRGYSQQAYTEALKTLTQPTPVVPAPVGESWRTPAPFVPAATGATVVAPDAQQAVEPSAPAALPARSSVLGERGGLGSSNPVATVHDAPFQDAPAQDAPAQEALDAWTPDALATAAPAPDVSAPAAVEPTPSPSAERIGEPWPSTPALDRTVEDTLDPARGGHAGPRVVAASPSARSFRPSEPDPLDPAYAVDPVAAKSEWLASAVLYEEMTSLLRSSPSLADAPATGATYQPAVELQTGPSLTRRARRAQASAEPDRSADGIDRDAEVLRERLRAFQSATRRARDEAASGAVPLDLDAELEAAFGPSGETAGPPDGYRGGH